MPSREAKAHYNTIKAFSKIFLSEAWPSKSFYNELWGTIYSKEWGGAWHSPLWHFIYPHHSSSTLWLLHPTIDTWTSTWQDITYNLHMYPHETKWLEKAMKDITNTWFVVLRWWRTDAKLGHPWWFPCIQWWHLAEANSYLCCILLHWYGSFVQLVW